MAIGEIFLAASLQALFDRLLSQDLLQFTRKEGMHKTLKKWEGKLATFESVLDHAEEKQLTDKDVKMWLDELQDLAYDMEDILDEFATEALRRKLVMPTHDDDHQGASSSTSKVRGVFTACCFSTSNWSPTAIKFNISMNSKIKSITSRMEDLYNKKADFELKDTVRKASSTSSAAAAAVYQIPPTTCLQTEFAVYGRDEEKAEVLDMVLSHEGLNDANFGVVPIVGMGGLGKTTLAREVYNDKAVKDFELKAWVCVSDDFDVLGISIKILKLITTSPCHLNDLNLVQLQLKEALVGRKFLIVLDDVWTKNYDLWETLRSPFKDGAPGSKVIVTTRSEEVASTMGLRPVGYYKLKRLSNDDCWSVFKMHAFQNRDINAHRNLELIFHDKVVQKCSGLPLAAKTLGGLLCSKQGDDEWEDILNSAIWDLPCENGILPVLKLSYHRLPSHLKRCFAYSAILPKDYEFNKKDVVLLWMAKGLIQKQNNNKPLEDLGGEYFNELLSRSLFQQSPSNESKFVMHDLVNDLAQWVSGETSFRLEENNEENMQLKMSKRARHFSFISTCYNGKAKFEVLHEVEWLRTFLALPPSKWRFENCFISVMVLSNLLLKFKKLRALSLEKYHIVELPDSIGGLIHLRYLNLSCTMIQTLPECASSLFNLQTLILSFCPRLMKLPSKMENMSNLQHLDVRGSNLIREMPLGIKELKDLRTLTNFIVGKDGACCSLEDLKTLKFLQGELYISRLENVVGVQDTREAILSNKKGLKVLELEWGSEFGNSLNEVEEENVLEMLQPHTNLRSLALKCYGGIRFPSWLGDASFSNMTVLRLERCVNCTSLPSLGLLSSLKDLTIVGMKKLKTLASEFYGAGCLKPFQSLEILRFEDLQEWDSWETTEKNEHVEIFPRLRDLSIENCPKLFGKLPDHLPLLEELVISGCAQLVVSLSSLPVLCKLKVNGCAQLVVSLSSLPVLCKLEVDGCRRLVLCSPSDSQSLNSMTLSNISELGNWSLQGFQKVERLEIDGCEELLQLWQNEISLEKTPKELRAFNSLKNLCIRGCPNLVLFPEICFLPLLTELKIINCYALMSLPEGMKQKNVHLESLEIAGNHSLSFMTRGPLPSSLKQLRLNKCEKLQYAFADADETHTSSSSSSSSYSENINTFLERLTVESCPSLTCLSTRDQLPATLRYLYIEHCSTITTLSRGQLPDSLQDLHIWRCPKVESITERFHNSMLLETISISNCSNLDSIPEGIHKLSRLRKIYIHTCPSLVCFPEEGLPNTNLREFTICNCKNLKALPRGMQTLNLLRIWSCPSIKSFPEECFRTKLTRLEIGNLDMYMYEQLIQCGLPKLTSLTSLQIIECPDVESFEIGMMLPTSLTHLSIFRFPKLKYLSSYGFQNLTSLVYLSIHNCPNFISFPKIGLPSSLMELYIYNCPMLQKRCRRDKGQEWSKISHISCVKIDNKLIDDLEEEE